MIALLQIHLGNFRPVIAVVEAATDVRELSLYYQEAKSCFVGRGCKACGTVPMEQRYYLSCLELEADHVRILGRGESAATASSACGRARNK